MRRSIRRLILRTALAAASYAAWAGAAPVDVGAQIPYHILDPSTAVSSIDFSFPQGRTFSDDELFQHMVLSAPGFIAGVRRKLSFLPLLSAPPPHLFTPLDLQRDVARLRGFYRRSGFLDTAIRYEVEYDEEDNRVAIDMIVSEGRPVVMKEVEVVDNEGNDLSGIVPDSLADSWDGFARTHRGSVGRRYTEASRALLVGQLLDWWRNRGWAFAQANSTLSVDSAQASATLTVRVDPGPRARIGTIELTGNDNVADDLILRSLPFHEGDWFSSDQLAAGQRRLFGLDLFRLVLVGAPEGQPRDSTVHVLVRLEESPPRLVTAEVGYVSAGGGLTGRAELAHRNFMGGARTLRVDGLMQTGLLTWAETPEREYRLSVSYRRPFTFHPRLTLSLSPFGSYRDNIVDRSWELGTSSTLIYELNQYSFLTFEHQYSTRKVLDYRLGATNSVDLQTLIQLIGAGALDSLDNRINRSTLSVSSTIGRFDPTLRRDALQARPTLEVTTPGALNTIEYTRVDLPVLGFLPFGKGFAVAARARWGRVFPYGKTLRGDSVAGVIEQAQLRGVLLTAGGTGSVRGWGNGLVGAKFPNLVFEDLGTDSSTVDTDGYLPAAGFARATGSFEVRMPFPFLSEDWGTHLFADAGRVWTPDDRFRGTDPYEEDRWFFGAGAGIDVRTLVGPIRLSVGYKLNPSPLDLRDPKKVFEAIANDRPLSSVPIDWTRRLHLHIALGSAF